MNYQSKYLELVSNGMKDVSEEYPNCSDFEKIIISLRKSNWNYSDIQKALGMPSKKQIRSILLKWAPNLIDNSKQKTIIVSDIESKLYNIINHNSRTFIIDDESWFFYIKDNILHCKDSEYDNEFRDFDKASQSQIFAQIKEQLNEQNFK